MDILSLTAVELAKAIREGKTTAVEATQAVLDRIAAGLRWKRRRPFWIGSQPVKIPTTAM